MGLKNLTNAEMAEVSSAWAEPGNRARALLESKPELSGVLPHLDAAHDAIMGLKPPAEDPRRAELSDLASELDSVHDTLVRGIYGYLTEAALLVDDGERLLRLRDSLMPAGLSSVIHATYVGQAGFAGLLRERLTPALQRELQTLPVPGGDLLSRVMAWLDAADRLGALEQERARMLDQPSEGPSTTEARSQWVRAVNALLSLAELTDLSDTDERVLLGVLQMVEARALQRAARRSTASVSRQALPVSDVAPSPTATPNRDAETG